MRDPKNSLSKLNNISALCSLQDPREAYLPRVDPLIDPQLPKQQAGFQRGKSNVDQGVLLTQNIKTSFEAKKKACAIFLDLTAVYNDTVTRKVS